MLGTSFTATPHKKYQRHRNTANPHVPLPIQWNVTQVSLLTSRSWGDWTVHTKLTSPIFTLLHNIDQLHKLILFHHYIIPKAFIKFILSRKFSTKFCNSYKDVSCLRSWRNTIRKLWTRSWSRYCFNFITDTSICLCPFLIYTLPLLRNLTLSFQYFDQKCRQTDIRKDIEPKKYYELLEQVQGPSLNLPCERKFLSCMGFTRLRSHSRGLSVS